MANENKEYKVTFFNALQNDGDEVLVRFPYTSEDQLGTIPAHSVKVGKAWKKIKCLRTSAYDPVDTCPLCAQQNKLISRFFIKLVYYVQQPDGTYKGQCAVWDRPEYIFKDKVLDLLHEYGTELPKAIFKIKRHGVHGDTQTNYEFLTPKQDIYPANVFPIDFSNFDNYKMEGINYYNLNANEMNNLIKTGNLPVKEKPADNTQGQVYGGPTPAYVEPPKAYQDAQPAMITPGSYYAQNVPPTYTPPTYAAPSVTTPGIQPAPNTNTVSYTPQDALANAQRQAEAQVVQPTRTYIVPPTGNGIQADNSQVTFTPQPANPLYGQVQPAPAMPQQQAARRYNYE